MADAVVLDDSNSFVSTSGGHRIFKRRWALNSQFAAPKALVFVCHGVGEHSGRYNLLANELSKLGYLVFSHDHYGHGHSQGIRVDITDFNIYVQDVLQHCDILTVEFPRTKIFIFGHSLGGAITISTAITRPHYFEGVILSAPAIIPDPATATPVKVFAARVFSKIVPQLQVGAVDPNWISRDSAVVAAYASDPLVWHGGLKARWASTLLGQLDFIREQIPSIEWPFIVLQGSEDKLVQKSGAELLYEKASSKNKTIKRYEGYYHELLNEPEEFASVVLKDIIDWIETIAK